MRRAHDLFQKQEPGEKRKLLNLLLSNCSWKDGELSVTWRQPFADLVVAAKADKYSYKDLLKED